MMKNYAKQEFLKQSIRKKRQLRMKKNSSRARGGLPGAVDLQKSIVFNNDLPRYLFEVMMLITLFGLMALS
jgi:hypothetical protein